MMFLSVNATVVAIIAFALLYLITTVTAVFGVLLDVLWEFHKNKLSVIIIQFFDSAPRLPTKYLLARLNPQPVHIVVIGDETAEHLLLLCPKWAVERQRYFGGLIDITDVF